MSVSFHTFWCFHLHNTIVLLKLRIYVPVCPSCGKFSPVDVCYTNVRKSKMKRAGQSDTNFTSIIDTVLNWPISEVASGYGHIASPALVNDKAKGDHHSATQSLASDRCAPPWRNKRPLAEMTDTGSKKRKMETVSCLPPEITSMLISSSLTAKPRCLLRLLVPDWKICEGEANGIMQILTYTRGGGVFPPSSVSCTFGHQDNDHIPTPMASFNPNIVALSHEFTSEYVRKLYRTHTQVFTLDISNPPKNANEDYPLRSLRALTVLPFDDEPTAPAKMMAYPTTTPIYEHLRNIVVHSPLRLLSMDTSAFDTADRVGRGCYTTLDLDRSAHLWLSWSDMPNLETVALDLRIYSHHTNTRRRCLGKDMIIARAFEMGRHLRLKTLVLAGLQSYGFYCNHHIRSVTEIEQLDTLDGEPNWIKIFRPAVREGGRIILVDKLCNWVPN